MGTIKSEQTMRRLFNEKNYSDSFEFIGKDEKKPKFLAKCKCCGKVHSYWAANALYVAKHIVCHYCGAASDGNDIWNRSPECESAMAYYAEGHTVKETAERFSISEYQINNSVKVRGLSNGRRFGELSDGYKESVRKESEQNIAKHLSSLGFDYAGGYVDRHGKVRIKCKSCGNMFERTADFAKRGNVVCKKCEHRKAIARQVQRKEERAEESKQKAIDRKRNKERAETEKADALFHLLNDKTHICSVCGKHFSISEFMESKGRTLIPTNPKYCSQKCNRKAMNKARKKAPSGRTGNYYNRARKYGCEYSTGITLKKLVARDGLKCRICGGMCDWNDHSWTEYSGPMYPSIDHIIPMSKGGGHVWDNVQVAHIICNSEKGDTV